MTEDVLLLKINTHLIPQSVHLTEGGNIKLDGNFSEVLGTNGVVIGELKRIEKSDDPDHVTLIYYDANEETERELTISAAQLPNLYEFVEKHRIWLEGLAAMKCAYPPAQIMAK